MLGSPWSYEIWLTTHAYKNFKNLEDEIFHETMCASLEFWYKFQVFFSLKKGWNLDQNGGNSKPCMQRLAFVTFLLQGKKTSSFGWKTGSLSPKNIFVISDRSHVQLVETF